MSTRCIVGVDGCPDGWLYVVEGASGVLSTGVASDITTLMSLLPNDAIVAIDVPIGLTDAGQRDCDRAARKLLGRPRGSSVFPAPVRAVLGIDDYRDACDVHRTADGRAMSQQAFGILPKITEADGRLRALPDDVRSRVYEAHPEVSFSLWNDGQPMQHAKKKADGRAERLALVEGAWPGAAESLERSLAETHGRVARDDLLDAFAALWTARRIRVGTELRLPSEPPVDRCGLRMMIFA